MRGIAVIISLVLSASAAMAQQDAFSLRLGPEIGGGLGHTWGNALDYNNGLVSGGLMFEGRMANAWGWAVRPAYARSVAIGSEIATAFGEDRLQLLTGPVWRADNGRTMRAYARTAPFVRLMGGAVSSVSTNTSDILPMAELGLGLKFRLNDRNDIELALAAQGAGTSQHNLQLAGMLTLAYHINFKERRIKFRSPPLNLVPRTTDANATPSQPSTPTSDWEAPMLPSRKVEFPPADPQQAKAPVVEKDETISQEKILTEEKEGKAGETVVRTETPRQEVETTVVETVPQETRDFSMEEKKSDTVQEKTAVPSQQKPVQQAVAPQQTTPTPQQQPVQVTVYSAPPQQAVPIAVPMPTGEDATARALRELAAQQGQMMDMLRELMADRNYRQAQPAPAVTAPSPKAATPTTADGRTEEQLRGEVARLSLEMAILSERFAALESRLAQQGAATPSPRREEASKAPLPKPAEPQPAAPAVPSEAPAQHEVLFAKNSYGLNSEQSAIISAMAQRALSDPALTVVVEGFADRTGPAEFNSIIARKRANEVLSELKRLGVPVSRTVFASYGDERSQDDPSYRKVVVRLMRGE